ncbi:MAG: serine hydrolase [Saprospiraceae bacterium]|nr:serine hydrolase [Saprospiraceae bacterium]MCB9320095.1 serine hydrolase [Lewinellaceae bacterium]
MRKLILLLFLAPCLLAQDIRLPRSTPEKEGVHSEGIIRFLDAAEAVSSSGIQFHSLMLLRHGKVVAEGWWSPYRSDLKHTMYSVSKSYTATAIGFAVAEGRLTLDDPVISFFPDKLPDTISPNLAAMKVRDLLSMSGGYDKEPIQAVLTDDWVKSFFTSPVAFEPGTHFLYNSAGTFILSAIVTKVTGQTALDYLQPRLFDPLGIHGLDWETSPGGINTGGWGLRQRTEDMAKFGQLFLQHGKWDGKQILPIGWVEEASSRKIWQNPDATQAQKDSSDWLQGYCFQMWRGRHNSYRGDGAMGQYIIVLPEKDAVIITTAEVSDMQKEFNLIWKYLYPAISDQEMLPESSTSDELADRLAQLRYVPGTGINNPEMEQSLTGKTLVIADNPESFESMRFNFTKDHSFVQFQEAGQSYRIRMGHGAWILDNTLRKGPYLVARATNNLEGLPPFQTAGSYSWEDDHTLKILLRYIESPHTAFITITLNGDEAAIDISHSFLGNNPPLHLTARIR